MTRYAEPERGNKKARILFLELAALGIDPKTGHVPRLRLTFSEIARLMRRVRENRDGLREVLKERHNPDVLASKQEGGI